MEQYISKSALIAEIERLKRELLQRKWQCRRGGLDKIMHQISILNKILSFLENLEVKEVGLIIHTIIAECCDWLAMNTDLSHDKIEGCRNLMLTVKDEQLKAQKGE